MGKRSWRRRHILLGAALLVVLAVVVPPLINLGRYQHRIAVSIGQSIGRPVHMSSVVLRLLPLPGLEISDFSVEEDPRFGAEPILSAPSVIAYLRLSSLWRGRLEIARIHFDEASLNLVRAPDGSWNFASILIQTAHSSTAPTGQRHAGSIPRFPYIEATGARINFKRGNEKEPFSFFDSDLSVWLESPDEWGVRFRAQPMRTDLVLDSGDTGILRIEGTLRRAATLAGMPVKLRAEWSSAPLGQLSRVAVGRDVGWRGGVDFSADISGLAGSAQIETLLKIEGLHRAELASAQPLAIKTACHASYQRWSRSLEDIACSSRIGDGELLLRGYVRQAPPRSGIALALEIRRVPASAVLTGLEEISDRVGSGARALGEFNGDFNYVSASGERAQISGEAEAHSLTLALPDSARPFALGPVRLFFAKRSAASAGSSPSPGAVSLSGSPPLLLQRMRFSLGGPVPLAIDGQLAASGFDLHVSGSGAIARLRGLSKSLAWPAAQPHWAGIAGATLGSPGTAALDVHVRGPWLLPESDPEHPAASAIASGSVQIRGADLVVPYLPRPLKVISALGTLHSTDIAWTDASIGYGPVEIEGALEYPTLCASAKLCAAHFELAAPSLDSAALRSALLSSDQNGELLRELLSRIDRRSASWPPLSGTFAIGNLSLGKLVVHDATGEVEIAGKSLRIRSLDGRLFNGALRLTGTLDAAGGRPQYDFDAMVSGVSLTPLSALFAEHWGSGAADFSAQWKMAGFTARDLAQSAAGTLSWNWKKGSLAAANAAPDAALPLLHFDDWRGNAAIGDSGIRITRSLLTRGREAIPISGTVSFDRALSLKSNFASEALSVTGTLEHPHLRTVTTQAEISR